MLRFDCPHCGNHLRLEDQYAGRDGWCRACKGMIVAPNPGDEAPGMESLPLATRYNRLYHLFKFAAAKADNYKLLYGRVRAQRESLAKELLSAAKWKERAAEAKRRFEKSEHQQRVLEDELNEAARRKHEVEQIVVGLRTQIEELQKAATAYLADDARSDREAVVAGANALVEEIEQRLESAVVEKNLLQERISYIEAARVQERARSDDEVAHYAEQFSRMQESVQTATAETAFYTAALDQTRLELDALRQEHERTVAELARLVERTSAPVANDVVPAVQREDAAIEPDASEHLRQRHDDLQYALAAATEALEDERRARKAVDGRVEAEQHELRQAQERIQELAEVLERECTHVVEQTRRERALLARVEVLEAAHEEHCAQIEQHNRQEEVLRTRLEELQSAAAQSDQYTKRTEMLEARIEELEEHHSEATARAARELLARSEELESVRDEQLSEAEQHAKVEESLQVRVRELEAQLETVHEQSRALGGVAEERDALQAERDELAELCDALQEALATPSFGGLPNELEPELLTAMPPVENANDDTEHVIIPEIVMDDVEDSRANPMITALLRFLREHREQG